MSWQMGWRIFMSMEVERTSFDAFEGVVEESVRVGEVLELAYGIVRRIVYLPFA